MKVICTSTYPDETQLKTLGEAFNKNQGFLVTKGKEYLVVAMQFEIESPNYGTGTWIQFISDYGNLSFAPLCLFEIVDGKIPKLWEVRYWKDGTLSFWPPSFYKEYYYDDLSEGVTEIVQDLKKTVSLIENDLI